MWLPQLNASRYRSWCARRNGAPDVQESQGREGLEEGKDGTTGECTIGERRSRSRRAWISQWLYRSRCCSFDSTHEDCGGVEPGQEEEIWCFKAGDCTRWRYGEFWWRALNVSWREEVGGGSKDFEKLTPRVPRGNLWPGGEVDGGGCAVAHAAARAGPTHLHSEGVGRTSVQDRTLQGSCSLSLGRSRHLRSVEERKHSRSSCEMLSITPTTGSVLRGPWKLGACLRFKPRSIASLQFVVAAPTAIHPGWRPAFLEASGPKMGGAGSVPLKRSGRLRLQETDPWKEVPDGAGGSQWCRPQEDAEVQGESKGCSGGRRVMSGDGYACPRLAPDYVPMDASDSGGMPLPGERASTVVIASVVNSLFRWTLKTKGSFRKFLLSVVAKPKGEIRSPTSKQGGDVHVPLWPMPVPYPEVFTKKVDSERDWRSWWFAWRSCRSPGSCLVNPMVHPMRFCLGVGLTPQQWSVVSMLRHLSFDSNTPEFVDATMMSRAAAKFESMEDVMGSLHRSLLSFEDTRYFGDRFGKPDDFDDSWMRCGSLVGKLEGANLSGAKPVIASRLEFPSAPSFDPVPFFDAETAELFMHPLDHAMHPEQYEGDVPVVSVHGSEREKVELYKKLAACGRLKAVDGSAARDPFVSGLFTVNKNSRLDRLILDARPPNLLEMPKSVWCGTMAHAGGLADLELGRDEVLCCSGLDLKDFFYQFQVSPQRTLRNVLAGPITNVQQAIEIFGDDFKAESKDTGVRVALATLAMGDLLACEFSQSAHLFSVPEIQRAAAWRAPHFANTCAQKQSHCRSDHRRPGGDGEIDCFGVWCQDPRCWWSLWPHQSSHQRILRKPPGSQHQEVFL